MNENRSLKSFTVVLFALNENTRCQCWSRECQDSICSELFSAAPRSQGLGFVSPTRTPQSRFYGGGVSKSEFRHVTCRSVGKQPHTFLLDKDLQMTEKKIGAFVSCIPSSAAQCDMRSQRHCTPMRRDKLISVLVQEQDSRLSHAGA